MRNVKITDMTLRQCANSLDAALSFKEKLEIARQLEKLNVDIIELPEIQNPKTDILFVRTASSFVKPPGEKVKLAGGVTKRSQ